MKIKNDISLLKFNSFKIDVLCDEFIQLENKQDLKNNLFQRSIERAQNIFILGGGSNILLTKNFKGSIIFPAFRGIKLIEETVDHYIVNVAAGENWHQFVTTCLEKRWYGLENLALIPGHVGATPVQNIGAYGIEVKDFIYKVKAFDLINKSFVDFATDECEFDYRASFFKKQQNQNRYIIYQVQFKLTKNRDTNISYVVLKKYLNENKMTNTPQDIYNAVVAIRSNKLPNPKEIGNAGSFFKNPIISKEKFDILKRAHPQIPHYAVGNNYKIPAGWLIEKAGWKGLRKMHGNTGFGVHKDQALVLVNYNNCSGLDIDNLAKEISEDILQKFNIKISREVITL